VPSALPIKRSAANASASIPYETRVGKFSLFPYRTVLPATAIPMRATNLLSPCIPPVPPQETPSGRLRRPLQRCPLPALRPERGSCALARRAAPSQPFKPWMGGQLQWRGCWRTGRANARGSQPTAPPGGVEEGPAGGCCKTGLGVRARWALLQGGGRAEQSRGTGRGPLPRYTTRAASCLMTSMA
jgi:hypothetical protein